MYKLLLYTAAPTLCIFPSLLLNVNQQVHMIILNSVRTLGEASPFGYEKNVLIFNVKSAKIYAKIIKI